MVPQPRSQAREEKERGPGNEVDGSSEGDLDLFSYSCFLFHSKVLNLAFLICAVTFCSRSFSVIAKLSPGKVNNNMVHLGQEV